MVNNGPNKREASSLIKNIMNFNKPKQEDVKQAEAGKGTSFFEKFSSQTSRKSGMSVSNMDEVVKFKLVEDLSLVTIPITSCLLVLVSYIILGAALFSAWEVRQKELFLTLFCSFLFTKFLIR